MTDETLPAITLPLQALDALHEAVILVDHRRDILTMNHAARDLIGEHEPGRNLALCLRHPHLIGSVDQVLRTGEAVQGHMTLAWPVERTFATHVMALNPAAQQRSVAILLNELTDQHRLEQMRRDFVANVSHELRSPLASLVGFIETLKGPASDDAEARERFLDIMQNEAERMTRLIDDLLSLNRVEVGEHIQPQGEVDVLSVLATVKDSLEPQAARRGIDMIIESDAEAHFVVGDEDEIRQVMHNLMDNAAKYASENSQVHVQVAAVGRIPDIGGNGVRIAIQDQGPGIPVEHVPRLTERFYRVDKGRSRRMGGTGLGLAIVKHIINRHRGRLTIRSQVDEGSTFTIYLPAPPDIGVN